MQFLAKLNKLRTWGEWHSLSYTYLCPSAKFERKKAFNLVGMALESSLLQASLTLVLMNDTRKKPSEQTLQHLGLVF